MSLLSEDPTVGMTVDELIGQVLSVGFPGTTPTAEILDLIQKHHVGSIMLFARNAEDVHQLRNLTRSLQTSAREAGHRFPLLISNDQENGMIQRLGRGSTIFPGNMALGAIDSEQIVYDVAQAVGQEMKALGINMNFAPVIDVNNNPDNPIIGNRAFGEDPMQVARLGVATVKGFASAGVITCLKHFPGHGDTAVDSHYALPTILHSLEHLQRVELVPFRYGIEAGADAVMTAHISFPALTGDESLPATLSSHVLQHLLREQLGFGGLVVTDCLEMDAIIDTVGIEAGTVDALKAGSDLLLISHTYSRQLQAVEAIRRALQTGYLSEERLREAAGRVLRLKARALSWEEALTNDQAMICVGSDLHRELSEKVYELSTTLVKDTKGLIPLNLKPEQRILVVYPRKEAWSQISDRVYPIAMLGEYIRLRHANVRILCFDPTAISSAYREIQRAVHEAALVIMVTVNANLDPQQAMLMQEVLQSNKPVIGIAGMFPYDLLAFPRLSTYLTTYEYTPPALEALARVLFGEIAPQGQLPVSLPDIPPGRKRFSFGLQSSRVQDKLELQEKEAG